MGWLCTHGFMPTLLGHARISDGRERGNTFRTGETRIGAGISRGAWRMEIQTAFAQGEMGTEPLKFSADSNH